MKGIERTSESRRRDEQFLRISDEQAAHDVHFTCGSDAVEGCFPAPDRFLSAFMCVWNVMIATG